MILAVLRTLAVPALLLAASVPPSTPVSAQETQREEILSFDVTVQVEADGWLEVTEEIRVRSLGNDIRRGIYRDFPTSFPREGGIGRINAPFEVVQVLRDGDPEPYTLQSVGGPADRGGIRVRIGDANRFLVDGVHTYTLTYRTIRWIRFGEERDVLTWNVTGNGWDFPILSASARVALPGPVDPGELTLEGWTGPEGSTESALTASFDPGLGADGAAVFTTTEPLGVREGLTIRLAFPTGVVAPPTEAQQAEWFRMDWGRWVDAGLVVLFVLAVYLLLWHRVGRDPSGRPEVVRYEPPEGFSPAALGHLVERGFDTRQLTAAMVSLAVGGWLEIERDGGNWILRRADGGDPSELAEDEEILLRKLWGSGLGRPGQTVTLKGSSHSTFRKAVKAFRKHLGREQEKRYFVLNRGWFAVGLAVTVLGFVALAWRVRFAVAPEGWFMGFWLTFWTMGTGTLVYRVVQLWRQAFAGNPLLFAGAALTSLFAVPFVAAELFVGYLLWQAVPGHLVGAAVALGAVNVLFYHLLERPTLKGRGVLDEAEGFRSFLTATEEDRIRRLQPAGSSLELFERYLPWAMALGVESAWAERFEDALDSAALAAAGGTGGALAWYHADGASHASLSGMTGSLGSAFSSSLSASSAAPSSSGSGGGGGGGFSGGGGGGGGGGGW